MINRGKFLPAVALVVCPPRRANPPRSPPNLADCWLTSVTTSPHIVLRDFLMCEDAPIEYFECKVEIAYEKVSLWHSLLHNITDKPKAPETESTIFEDPPTSTLWVTARIPQGAKGDSLIYQSPRAVVDQYIGYPDEHRAPEWTRRTTKAFEFRQPRVGFVHIFLRLALNQWNLPVPGRLHHMHLWVQSALVCNFFCIGCRF